MSTPVRNVLPFDRFIALAGPATALWRTVLGIGLIGGFYYIALPLILRLFLSDTAQNALEQGSSRGAVLTLLALTSGQIFALAVVLRWLHGRSLMSVLGHPVLGAEAFVRVFPAVLAISAVAVFFPPWTQTIADSQHGLGWILTVIIALPLLLVQVSAEELIFRGYLIQQLGALSQSRWVWQVCPALLFGIPHALNADDPLLGLFWAIWATALGLALADLTARHGTLGPAIGLHLGINTLPILLLNVQGAPMSGLALMLAPAPPASELGLDDLFSPIGIGILIYILIDCSIRVGTLWLSARVAIRR